MIRESLSVALIPAALFALVAPPAHAEEARVDQIERLDIESGEWEAELQTIIIPPSNGLESFLKTGVTIERGITERFGLGVEFEFEREGMAQFALNEISIQAKLAIVDQERFGLGLGLQTGIVIDSGSGAIGSETFLIAEKDISAWNLAGNVVLANEAGQWGEWTASYGLRANRQISDSLEIGIENGGGIAGFDEPSHWIGPVVSWEPFGDAGPEVEASAFAGLTNATPSAQFRLELDWAF